MALAGLGEKIDVEGSAGYPAAYTKRNGLQVSLKTAPQLGKIRYRNAKEIRTPRRLIMVLVGGECCKLYFAVGQ